MESTTTLERYKQLDAMLLELAFIDAKYVKKYNKHLADYKKAVENGKEAGFITNLKMLNLVKTHTKVMGNN